MALNYLSWVLNSEPRSSGKALTTLKLLKHLYSLLVTPKHKRTVLLCMTILITFFSFFLIDKCVPLQIWVATRNFTNFYYEWPCEKLQLVSFPVDCFSAVNPIWGSACESIKTTGHIGKKLEVWVKVDVQLKILKTANLTKTEVISNNVMLGKNTKESRW